MREPPVAAIIANVASSEHGGKNDRDWHRVGRRYSVCMLLKYCPNGECANFQCKVETSIARCRLCGWEMQLVKKQSDRVTDDASSRKTA
jgi:hypothetical protein